MSRHSWRLCWLRPLTPPPCCVEAPMRHWILLEAVNRGLIVGAVVWHFAEASIAVGVCLCVSVLSCDGKDAHQLSSIIEYRFIKWKGRGGGRQLSANQSSRSSSKVLFTACGLPARSCRVLSGASEGHCWLVFQACSSNLFPSNVSSVRYRQRPTVGSRWYSSFTHCILPFVDGASPPHLLLHRPPSSYFSIELHQLCSVAPALATACVFTPDVEVCCFSNRLFSFSLLPNPILPSPLRCSSLPPTPSPLSPMSPMSILNHQPNFLLSSINPSPPLLHRCIVHGSAPNASLLHLCFLILSILGFFPPVLCLIFPVSCMHAGLLCLTFRPLRARC